ncbi:MAG: tetratricopeptide repeat protein [Candidatus Acidiferrales bacterium]
MAFNKSKALENALKYLNQGKVAQAIAEYQQILRNDAKDQATLMTVGDLFARQGDMPQAIEYFERLAQVYLNDGFNSKAIAIYKKIAKLAPNELAPLERLADLYVQQGVLSEARPLFLQIAEAYLKANKSQKALEVLHRLLDVEPDNLRVQMRLAELYNVMGQKKEAAQTYLAYAQRLFDRGEMDEAVKLIERALEVDSANAGAMQLKAKALAHSGKNAPAIAILESHPEANAGGDVTNMLLDLELKAGQTEKAANRGRKILARGHAHFAPLYKVAEAEIEGGKTSEALGLLRELRDPMIEAGEQDKFLKALSAITQKDPKQIAPLEELVDFCRHTSNSHQLPLAIIQLSDACADAGNFARAEELLQDLIERNKDDERLVERLKKLRARSGGAAPAPATVEEAPPPESIEEAPRFEERAAEETPAAPSEIIEESLDEETQKYIAQALTDVDLFSSYGLTQKATHLLENVLERAPRHTPTLERLLDMYLGAGNDRRTAELASQLEQIHRERNDTVNADRFAELRQRYQKAAGIATEDLPAAPALPTPAAVDTPPAEAAGPQPRVKASVEAAPAEPPQFKVVAEPSHAAAPPVAAAPIEFEIPVAAPEPTHVDEPAASIPVATPLETAAAPAAPHQAAPIEEVDLSDEWEAMASEVVEPAAPAPPHGAAPAHVEPEPAAPQAEFVIEDPEPEGAPVPEPEPAEVHAASEKTDQEAAPEAAFEIIEHHAAQTPAAEESGDFELELTPGPAAPKEKAGAATTEDFISELVAEIDDMEAPVAAAPEPVAAAAPSSNGSSSVPAPTAETLNELAEVFQEFRDELGELGEEDEDLETHYNLGIAYREMGLLDEAIGEFQKVAKAVAKGKPFRYAMNCSTMLGLSFMDKGEPKIAALWYQRALEVPGLEQETVLALRYDLGLALDEAGEEKSALDCFRQVYAMNIDYRDVADRIATLQKR